MGRGGERRREGASAWCACACACTYNGGRGGWMQELASSRSRHCLLDILAHYFFGGFSFPWRGRCCHRLQRRRRLEGRRHLCLLPMSVFLLQQAGSAASHMTQYFTHYTCSQRCCEMQRYCNTGCARLGTSAGVRPLCAASSFFPEAPWSTPTVLLTHLPLAPGLPPVRQLTPLGGLEPQGADTPSPSLFCARHRLMPRGVR